MAAVSNIPRDIQDSVREALDRRVKLSIKRMVRQELRGDKVENKILAFSACRLFILTAKVPSKVDFSIHYLDIQAIESKKPNQFSITVGDKTHAFRTLETDTEEVNHMITHVGTSLKQIFPALPLERLIKKVEVTPADRLKVMYDMMKDIEKKDVGPCGGFSHMYACMCDYHMTPYREEVSWDVDTIYLSQDSRELCLKDFDHLDGRDLIPVISALEHNSWFTKLNCNNVKLMAEASSEVLKVVLKNVTLEELHLSNSGIKVDFVQKLSTALLSNPSCQITKLDLSNNLLEDRGLLHLTGALIKLNPGLTYLNLTKIGVTGKSLVKLTEALTSNKNMSTSLQTLILTDNTIKGEETAIQSLFTYLAVPNSIVHLDLSNTEVPLDALSAALLRGCCQNLQHLNLSGNMFSHKKTKDVLVPATWKNFFASAYSLQELNLSGSKLPPESIKELLLGLSSNSNITGLHLDLSDNDLRSQGARLIESCISYNTNITSLDISDNAFENDLCSLLAWIQQNKTLKKLLIGKNFNNIKPKQAANVLESVVQLIQDEDSQLESLSLADAKLRTETAIIMNALGSNNTLREIDISGNHMGDFGAKMLAKALQINTKLRTVYWDRNNTTVQGFEDIASALEKNYALKKMPVPVNDVCTALKLHPERMEKAVQTIETLLQRNHSPRKFSSDQAYRLQQGFLISSTQQLVDRLVVQVQDTMNALSLGNTDSIQSDMDRASDLMKDADKSRQILPRLQEIAVKSQAAGNPVQTKLTSMAKELEEVLERHLKWTVDDMLKCADNQCVTVMADKEFQTTLEEDCKKRSSLAPTFTKCLFDGVETDIINKLSECNLSVAAHVSDKVTDEVIDNLSKSHKILTNHLNVQKSATKRETTKTSKETKNEVNVITITEEDKDPSKSESPGLAEKRKTLCQIRKQRPQSVVDQKLDVTPDNEHTPNGNHGDRTLRTLTEEREAMSKGEAMRDAPSSGAVENLEYKGLYLDSMSTSFTSLSKDSFDDEPDQKSRTAEKVEIDSLDVLPELSGVPKLSHVNKARPKRVKAHAVSRPMTKPVNLVEDEALQTPDTNSFFDNSTSPSSTMSTSMTKMDENENEKTPLSNAKPEKKKWSPFASKDKDKEKKEKGSGKSGFASGFSNLFSRKGSSSSSQSKFNRDSEKRASENAKIDKKSSDPSKLNGPVNKEKKEDAGKSVESPPPTATSPSALSSSTSPSASEEKSPPVFSGPKIPSGRGKMLIGGDVLEEMKQKRLAAKSEKAANTSDEKRSSGSTDIETKKTENEETNLRSKMSDEAKLTRLPSDKSPSHKAEVKRTPSGEVKVTKPPVEEVKVSRSPSEDVKVSRSPSEEVKVSRSPSEEVKVNMSASEDVKVAKSPSEDIKITKTPSEGAKVPKSPSEVVTVSRPTSEDIKVTKPPSEKSSISKPPPEDVKPTLPSVVDSMINRTSDENSPGKSAFSKDLESSVKRTSLERPKIITTAKEDVNVSSVTSNKTSTDAKSLTDKPSSPVKSPDNSVNSPEVKSPVHLTKPLEPKRDSGSKVLVESPQSSLTTTNEKKTEDNVSTSTTKINEDVTLSKPKTALMPPAKRPTPRPRTVKPTPTTPNDENTSPAVLPPKKLTKPPPPLPGSKPKPQPPMKPRITMMKPTPDDSVPAIVNSSSSTNNNSPSGIVYDSSTLRLSVKGKIKKLGLEKKLQEDEKLNSPLGPSKRANSAPRETPTISTDSMDSRPVSMFAGGKSPRSSVTSPDTPDTPKSANGLKEPVPSNQSDSPNITDKKEDPPNKRASLAEEEIIYI